MSVPTHATSSAAPPEYIAAMQPDLVLTYQRWIDDAEYDLLSSIAPTVVIGDGDTGWREHFEETAAAVGYDEAAAEILSDVDERFDQARAAVDGLPLSALAITPGPLLRAYTDDSTALTDVLTQLGAQFLPTDVPDTDGAGRITLSMERLDELAGDVLVLFQTDLIEGELDALAEVQRSPLWSSIPAVGDDSVVTLDRLGYPGALGAGQLATDLEAALQQA
ncbi:MAG: ABC transporter substrate-binding protein [Actinomycetota bacterium]